MKQILGVLAIMAAGMVSQSAGQTVIARWNMVPAPSEGFPGDNPKVKDVRVASGEGVDFGNSLEPAPVDDLWSFNGNGDSYATSADVPPAAMFVNGFDGGSHSYDASAIAAVDGALFYPVDQYGSEFAFTDAFTVECFFKTTGDQSQAGTMEILLQSEGFFRYALIMNEGGDGNVRFAINDGVGTIPFVDINSASVRNYADGEWHYLIAQYDPSVGNNGSLTLTLVNEDGTGDTATHFINESFNGLPSGVDANLFIGRDRFPLGDGSRTFLGLIDEVQLTDGLVSDGDRLGVLPDPGEPDYAVLAKWSMDDSGGSNPVVLDTRVGQGEGGPDDLWTFNGLPNGEYPTSADVPPAGMFDNGNSGTAQSFDASAFEAVDGALFFPQDQYGDEFSFTDSFSVECFFKTNGDQSGAGTMQILLQGQSFFRYALVMNEAGPGGVRFALNDGEGSIPLVDLTARNYADGEWHYVQAVYNASSGVNGELTLSIANEDGSFDSATLAVDGSFQGLPNGNDGNMLIGRNTFEVAEDPRTFAGLIDEVQMTRGVVEDSDRLGLLGGGCTADWNLDGVVDTQDFIAYLNDWAPRNPVADLNGDDVVDTQDFIAFLNLWAAGC